MGTRRIGEMLVAEGLLSQTVVNRALGFQRLSADRIKLGSILLDWDLLAEEALLATLAKSYRCPAVSWSTLAGAPIEVVRLLPAAHAVRFYAIPYALEGNLLRVAFVDPSNLAANDEISTITRKRVEPGVATEVRLLQAQQKFYGRHLPHEFRSILMKIERRPTQTRRSTAQKTAAELQTSNPSGSIADSTGGSTQPATTSPSAHPDSRESHRIPIDRENDSLSPPELPTFGPPEPATTPTQFFPSVPAPRPDRHTGPTRLDNPDRVAASGEDPIRSGEDSLTNWVGDALTAFQRDPAVGHSPSPPFPASPSAREAWGVRPPTSVTAPRAAPAWPDDAISDMWRPSPSEDGEEGPSSMRRDSAEDIGPQLWEARNRDEIGEAVLQNSLTDLPRVLLFGAGKTAIMGWCGRGPSLASADIASVRIPISQQSVFATVKRTGIPHFGLVDPNEWPPSLAPLLGSKPLDCAVFPVRILDGVAAFLYVDRLGRPMQYHDFAMIARAAAGTTSVIAHFLLKQNTPVA